MPIKRKITEPDDVYQYSSARFYLYGKQGVYPVMNYLELEDIDLTQSVSALTPSPRQRTNPERLGCEAIFKEFVGRS